MADSLPIDLCREILLRLPVKSLIRLTAVSKSWKSLITSREFIHAHLSNAKTHPLLLGGYGRCMNRFLFMFTGSIRFGCHHELEYPNMPVLDYLRVVGSSDGLICLTAAVDWYTPKHSIIVWNPSVRNHVVLPRPTVVPKASQITILGFGVYKVVRIVYGLNRSHAEVYSLGAGAGAGRWRRVEGIEEFGNKFRLKGCQVLLNGALHWFCRDGRNSWILSFEIGGEVFSKVVLPDVLAKRKVRVSSVEGSLAVVKCSRQLDDRCYVWVMMEYGVKESWVKLYSFDLAKDLERVVGFSKGEAILAYEDKDLVAYNLQTGTTNDIGIHGCNLPFFIHDYVESLLLLSTSI